MPLAQIINYSVYGILALFAGLGVFLGFRRGIARQTIRFVTVIVAFFFAIIAMLRLPKLLNMLG